MPANSPDFLCYWKKFKIDLLLLSGPWHDIVFHYICCSAMWKADNTANKSLERDCGSRAVLSLTTSTPFIPKKKKIWPVMYQKDLSRRLRGCFPGLGDDLETRREPKLKTFPGRRNYWIIFWSQVVTLAKTCFACLWCFFLHWRGGYPGT